jgi:hypothetical protein
MKELENEDDMLNQLPLFQRRLNPENPSPENPNPVSQDVPENQENNRMMVQQLIY